MNSTQISCVLSKAIEFATIQHHGQTRKDKKTPYIVHPIAVKDIVTTKFSDNLTDLGLLLTQVAALFHDIPEDVERYKNKEEELVHDFFLYTNHVLHEWFVEELTIALKVLNKNRHKHYLDFIVQVKEVSLYACFVKQGDIEHNMSDLQEGSLKDKYRLAQYILTH